MVAPLLHMTGIFYAANTGCMEGFFMIFLVSFDSENIT
jgi:hypothetical protein